MHKYSRGGVSGGFRTRSIFTSSNTRPSFTVESSSTASLVPSFFPGGGGGGGGEGEEKDWLRGYISTARD